MNRTALILLSAGCALFIGLIAWQGAGTVAAMLTLAGGGLLLVAAFHLLPLLLDAAAIRVMVTGPYTLRSALLARWSGESVNSLLPAGQIGGPIAMVRHLSQRRVPSADAAAAITVSTTLQTVAQIVFALLGLLVFGVHAAGDALHALWVPVLGVILLAALLLYGFYTAQRRGLFGRLSRLFAKFSASRDWSALHESASAIDAAVHALYYERGRAVASFGLSLVGWLVGTGEVWLILHFIGHPVSWTDALLLESLGQAIRGAAFAIPGSLGVQEGGYLLLAPLVGLPADMALALSLAKRARELLLGLPGLVYLHYSERGWHRKRNTVQAPAADSALS